MCESLTVSIHAPVWGAKLVNITCQVVHLFQSTHPCGVRISTCSPLHLYTSFNPRTRVGCEGLFEQKWGYRTVSIHAPVWGAKSEQNELTIQLDVSIHAPVWGAKLLSCVLYKKWRVSIHAPVWGANRIERRRLDWQSFNPRTRVGCESTSVTRYLGLFCFNPRTRVGCEKDGKLTTDKLLVSIHAPVWGAKNCEVVNIHIAEVSIHAPVWGAKRSYCILCNLWTFQSTHPCGVRKWLPNAGASNQRFNPRTRVGCEDRAWSTIL